MRNFEEKLHVLLSRVEVAMFFFLSYLEHVLRSKTFLGHVLYLISNVYILHVFGF